MPITSLSAENQHNEEHSYENPGVPDNYESLDPENIGTSIYQKLHLNNKDINYCNETFDLRTLENDKESNKCAKDHEVEGIMILTT